MHRKRSHDRHRRTDCSHPWQQHRSQTTSVTSCQERKALFVSWKHCGLNVQIDPTQMSEGSVGPMRVPEKGIFFVSRQEAFVPCTKILGWEIAIDRMFQRKEENSAFSCASVNWLALYIALLFKYSHGVHLSQDQRICCPEHVEFRRIKPICRMQAKQFFGAFSAVGLHSCTLETTALAVKFSFPCRVHVPKRQKITGDYFVARFFSFFWGGEGVCAWQIVHAQRFRCLTQLVTEQWHTSFYNAIRKNACGFFLWLMATRKDTHGAEVACSICLLFVQTSCADFCL